LITNIQKFFDRHIARSDKNLAADPQRRLHLAAAALLIETARVDYAEDPKELEQIQQLLQSHFNLGEEDTAALISLAELEADQMTSYFQFTSIINKECDIHDKAQILKLMWQIAYADGRIDKFEQHMLGKIASLLYIPREQMVAAKRAAENESGTNG
jgi:uncharacterized tellurite resistance protein B-like protein